MKQVNVESLVSFTRGMHSIYGMIRKHRTGDHCSYDEVEKVIRQIIIEAYTEGHSVAVNRCQNAMFEIQSESQTLFDVLK